MKLNFFVIFLRYIATPALVFILLGIPVMQPSYAAPADRCHDKAAMYQLTFSLRDSGMTDKHILTQTWFFSGFSDSERQQAVYRVKREGELGFMSAKALYQHVLRDCRSASS